MPTKAPSTDSIIDRFAPILEKTGSKDRTRIEKHLAACDAEPTSAHGRMWRRLATALAELVPVAMQFAGNNSWKFYIPDGKYRMQVFALEDPGDSTLRIYLPDVLSEALKAKILAKAGKSHDFTVSGTQAPLRIDALELDNSSEAPEHYKHMLGWNRKAIRITLSTTEPEEPQAAAAHALVTLAARKWANATAAKPAPAATP